MKKSKTSAPNEKTNYAEGQFMRSQRSRRGHFVLASKRNAFTESWLLTYTDIVTLLITMFIVLLANATWGEQRPEHASTLNPLFQKDIFDTLISNNRSFGIVEEKGFLPVQDQPDSRPAPQREDKDTLREKLDKMAEKEKMDNAKRIREQIADLGVGDDVGVDVLPKGVSIRIGEDVLFETGQADMQEKGENLFDSILPSLQEGDFDIIIEGHTDSVPINTEKYPSNWELSAARAITVVHYLIQKGIDPHRLRAVARADTKPLSTNETPEGRAKNRRVNVILDL